MLPSPSGEITYLEVEQEHQVLNEIMYENKLMSQGSKLYKLWTLNQTKIFINESSAYKFY